MKVFIILSVAVAVATAGPLSAFFSYVLNLEANILNVAGGLSGGISSSQAYLGGYLQGLIASGSSVNNQGLIGGINILSFVTGLVDVGPNGIMGGGTIFDDAGKVIEIGPDGAFLAGYIDGLIVDSTYIDENGLAGQIELLQDVFMASLNAGSSKLQAGGSIFNGEGTLNTGISPNEAYLVGQYAGVALGSLNVSKNGTSENIVLLSGLFNGTIAVKSNGLLLGGSILDGEGQLIAGVDRDRAFIAGTLAGILSGSVVGA